LFYQKSVKIWLRKHWKRATSVIVIATISSAGIMLIPTGDESKEPLKLEPYIYWSAPPDSFGISETKDVNISFYRSWLNSTVVWSLQKSTDNVHWLDCSKLLLVEKDWNPINLSEKHTLSWVSDSEAYYQLLLKTDDVKSYQDKSIDARQAEDKMLLNFSITDSEDYYIFYDWSDYKASPEFNKTVFSKSMDIVSNKQQFSWKVYTNVKMLKDEKMVIDPTFGDSGLTGTTNLVMEDCIRGGKFQMGAVGGTGDSITAKITITTPAKKVKCAIYNADNTLLANSVTEEITVPVQAATATTFNFGATKPVLVASTWYYISVWSESESEYGYILCTVSGGDGIFYDDQTYNGFPSTWTGTTLDADGLLAIYCTYNVAPTITGEIPLNNSIDIGLSPVCNVTVNDVDDDKMNVTFASNYSGSWVNYKTMDVGTDGIIDDAVVDSEE
jgi:hypothetical protein